MANSARRGPLWDDAGFTSANWGTIIAYQAIGPGLGCVKDRCSNHLASHSIIARKLQTVLVKYRYRQHLNSQLTRESSIYETAG